MDVVLGNPFVNAVAIPLIVAFFTGAMKVLARHGDPQPEDKMYGFELMFAAGTFQLAWLGSIYGLHRHEPYINFRVVQSWLQLSVIIGVTIYVAREMRYIAADHGGELSDVGRRFNNTRGLAVLFSVFVLNFRADLLYAGFRQLMRWLGKGS
jgi:hypothetical protein